MGDNCDSCDSQSAMPTDDGQLRDCDYSQMKLPKPTKAQSRPSVGELSDLDVAWLSVAAALLHKSQAQVLQTAVIIYLTRNRQDHLARLHIIANREGLSIEDAFVKILMDELEP
jgi:hypothetical protein